MKTLLDPTSNAFPFQPSEDVDRHAEYGLTKREYFAAMAMAAYNTNPEIYSKPAHERAIWAVEDADALIDALNKQEVSHEA